MDAWWLLRLGSGLLLGLVFGLGHLALLRHSLARCEELGSLRARQALVRGLPVRLALWTPAMWLAARGGLWACVGLALGMLASRWFAWRRIARTI